MIIALLLLFASASIASPINIIDNPGFEAGMAAWTSGFAEEPTIDTTEAHSGNSSAKIAVDGATAALDSIRLGIGPDIDRQGNYEISAWIKSGGIEKGDFGGRVYFYAANGEHVEMYTFGKETPDAAAHDWQQ
ncbi:MAG: hypothetical protein R6V19_18010, partial [Armatimonadota bacterium]